MFFLLNRLDNMTAHGKTCPVTGQMVYIGYNLIDINGDGVTDVTVGAGSYTPLQLPTKKRG
mgnify:CR=1 FL=1